MNPPTEQGSARRSKLSSNKSSFDQVRIEVCSNKWQIITWLALRGLREGDSDSLCDCVDGPHTHVSTVWVLCGMQCGNWGSYVLMIRKLRFIKNVFRKLLLFLWGAIVIWPFAALNYSDAPRLAPSCSCSWWRGHCLPHGMLQLH